MEERRYDLSFMKEYAELYNLTDMDISNMLKIDGRVVIGFNAVKNYLSGEKRIRESIMEEILYELGYKDYESFKNDILRKINNKKENDQKIINERIEKEKIKREKEEKKQVKELSKTIDNTIDFNSMNNKDRIIMSILLDDNLSNKSIKEITEFLGVSYNYVKNILENIDIEEVKVKTKV